MERYTAAIGMMVGTVVEDAGKLGSGVLWVEKLANITFGTANTEWEKYNLLQFPIQYEGGSSLKQYKAIVQGSRMVAITGSEYRLLPNEEAVEISDDTARIVGAVPFNEFKGEWYNRMSTHVIYNRQKTRIHALYAFDEPVNMGGGDKIQLGFAVHNGIDGGRAFGAGGFTFRTACSNMVLMGWKGHRMEFDQRETLSWVYRRHTAGMEIERPELEKTLLAVIAQTRKVLDQYRLWKEQELNAKIAERLIAAVPKKFLPAYIETSEGKLKQLLATPNLWSVYNEVTFALTHKSKADLDTKEERFGKLHAALVVA